MSEWEIVLREVKGGDREPEDTTHKYKHQRRGRDQTDCGYRVQTKGEQSRPTAEHNTYDIPQLEQ